MTPEANRGEAHIAPEGLQQQARSVGERFGMMYANAYSFKRRKGLRTAVACLALVLGTTVFAQDVQDSVSWKPLSEYEFPGLAKAISVDLRGIDVVEAIKFLAVEGKLNVVISKDVSGQLHLLLDKITVAEGLQNIFSITNLAYEVRGNVIKVLSAREFKALHGIEFYDRRVTETFEMTYSKPSKVAGVLQNVKTDKGTIIYDDATGILIVRDIPEKMDQIRQIVQASEVPGLSRRLPLQTRFYRLQYARVADVQDDIQQVVGENGLVKADTRTNTLIVTELPENFEAVEAHIQNLDRKVPEVHIQAKIVEVTLSDNNKFGIDWAELSSWSLGMNFLESDIDLKTDGRLQLMTTTGIEQRIIFDALKRIGEVQVLADPSITVQDGNEATIKVITDQPYESGTSEVDSGGVTTSYTNYEFIEVGVSLAVIPTINDEGFINMLISPEVSSIRNVWYGGDPQAAGAVPVVTKSTASTTVTIKDGVTVMIAGLIREELTDTESRFPLLGDIYLLGKLFTHTEEIVTRSETIIFITPHIVDGTKSLDFNPSSGGGKKIKGLRR